MGQADVPMSDATASAHSAPRIGAASEDAARLFLKNLPSGLSATRGLIFGSRARGEDHDESDTDLAVILSGPPGDRWSATRQMARLAFDILLETDVLIDPLAIWEVELAHPDRFINPTLLRAILRDGVVVWLAIAAAV